MKNFLVLEKALEIVESQLMEDLTPQQLASACGYSLSNLQKLFSRVFHIGIADYISRRRLSCGARMLLETDDSILDIALSCQYHSHESFIRAFTALWGVTPSEFRKKHTFSEIFPKLTFKPTDYKKEGKVMAKRQFDITRLYEYLQERDGKYVVCFDIFGLDSINKIGHKAGDLVIAEAFGRIDRETGDGELLFRVGGDEFALITDYDSREQVQEAIQRVLRANGSPVVYNATEIPVAMRAAAIRMRRENMKYSKLFTTLCDAIDSSRASEGAVWIED
jgi:AraC family transcriptional regulator